MTQEEKAKAYDDALEKAKEALKTDIHESGILAIQRMFPQLRESRDEQIRKAIIKSLDMPFPEDNLPGTDVTYEEAIAYLEKQKEQIPYTDFVIKPHKGDDNNPYDMRVSEAQEYAIKRGFGIPFNDGEVYVDERHLTQTIGNILRWADEHPKEQPASDCRETCKGYRETGKCFVDGPCVAKQETSKELYEEVNRYYSDNFAYLTSDQPTLSIISNIARHFAEWQKAKMGEQAREQLAKDEITLADLVAFDEGCSLGRRLERQNMIKEAVEGEVVKDINNKLGAVTAKNVNLDKFKFGDKVKILVIKDEGK